MNFENIPQRTKSFDLSDIYLPDGRHISMHDIYIDLHPIHDMSLVLRYQEVFGTGESCTIGEVITLERSLRDIGKANDFFDNLLCHNYEIPIDSENMTRLISLNLLEDVLLLESRRLFPSH